MVRGSGGGLARLLEGGSVAGLTDGQLLDRFATRRGDPAEAAFEALVKRHGPMVARVCRRNLRDENDVEDAFQATFLVLVRRADSLGERELLAPWLYGVAHRVARKARAVAAKRRGREGDRAAAEPPARLDYAAAVGVELAPVLHEEVNRLPAKYREPVILCHLQGLTHAEAAQELAWPVGTVSVRLVRARQILADRLTRRGVTASVATVAAALAAEGSVAAALVAPTAWVHAAAVAAAGGLSLTTATTVGPVSAGALTLARRTSMTMLLSAWKWLIIPPTIALATATGAGLIGSAGQGDDPQMPPRAQVQTVVKQEPPASGKTKAQRIAEQATFEQNVNKGGDLPSALDYYQKPGTYSDLARMVGMFQQQHPGSPVEVIFKADGTLSLRAGDKTTAPAIKAVLETSLTLALDGPAAVVPGQQIVYTLTVTNPGPALTKPIVVTAALPHEGGKLARGPLPAQATFMAKDRKLAWKVDRLNQGQSARYKFTYETSTPGQYRCVAEVVAEPFRAVDELITAVGEPPQPTPAMPEDQPEPTLAEPKPVVVPPVVALGNDHFELGKLPADYFDLPASKPGEPGSPRPVQIGQKLLVEVLEALPGRPITGERVVRLDGTISLGFYGDLTVVGLNRDQIKVKVIEKLRHYLSDSVLGLIMHDVVDPPQVAAVPPLQSNRVYIDDQSEPTAPPSGPRQPARPSAPPRPLSGPVPVRVGQTVVVEVLEALPGRPITGERIVRPDGTISLGFYGDLAIAGLTRQEIKVRVIEHLRRFLTDEMLGLKVVDAATNQRKAVAPGLSDRVFVEDELDYDPTTTTPPAADGKVRVGQLLAVEALQALPGRPITGQRIVHPDGTINLGFYGEVPVVGLTRTEVKAKVIDHLRTKLTDEQLGLVQINDQGARQTVAPVDSPHVFVDDVVIRPEPAQAAKLQAQVADLSSRLDAALAAIRELREEQAKPQPAPATNPAPQPAPPTTFKRDLAPPGGQDQALHAAPASPVRLVALDAPAPAPADPGVELDRVLAAWDKQSAQTRSLQVVCERVDHSAAWGDKTSQGTMLLQSPGLACLEFHQALTEPDGKPLRKLNASGQLVLEVKPEPDARFVWTGKELLYYDWDQKAIYAYPIDPATGGPGWPFQDFVTFLKLPFLFELTTAEVRQRYDLRWLSQDGQTDLIEITPRDRTERLHFQRAILALDRTTCTPIKLVFFPRNSHESQEFHYTRVDRNPAVDPAFFRPVKSLPGWKTIEPWKTAPRWLVDFVEGLDNWTAKSDAALLPTRPPAAQEDKKP